MAQDVVMLMLISQAVMTAAMNRNGTFEVLSGACLKVLVTIIMIIITIIVVVIIITTQNDIDDDNDNDSDSNK